MASINKKAVSAVAPLNTPGVFPTGIPSAVAALTSTLSYPTECKAITFRCAEACRKSLSRRVPTHNKASQSCVLAINSSCLSPLFSFHSFTSSPASIINFRPSSGITLVTNTFINTVLYKINNLLGQKFYKIKKAASKS
ncbi:hypothetical protein D3C85_1259120 [compost metagenome]